MPGKQKYIATSPPAPQVAAQESLAVLTALSGAMAVLILSPTGMILAANANFMAYTTWRSLPSGQHPYSILFPPGNTEKYDALLARITSGQFHTQCVQHATPEGRTLWLDAMYVPVFNSGQVLEKIIVLQSDATARVIEEQHSRDYLDLLSLSINETGNAVFIMDSSHRIVFQNASFTRMLGYAPKDTMGKRPREIFYAQPSIMAMIDAFAAALSIGQSYQAEARIQDKQHRPVWISIIVNPIVNTAGTLVNAVCILTDITNLKMQEILQYKAFNAMAHDVSLEDTMALVCQEIDEITTETLASVHHVDAEHQLQSLAGPSLPPVYHSIARELMARHTEPFAQTYYFNQAVPFTELERDPLWADYQYRFVPTGLCAVWMTLIHAPNGQAIGVLVFYCFEELYPTPFHQQLIDLVTPIFALALARETTRSRIEKLAYYDGLTGLANRSKLSMLASEAIAQAADTDGCVALLFIDLDRFKQVNDSLGHHAGDELLRTIAARLTSVARKSDIVGRLSGDEFLVVLPHCQRDAIAEIAARIQHTLAMTCHINGVAINPSASIGISIFPDNGNTIETLLHRADMAMYTAKEKMHGSFGFFSEAQNTLAQDRLTFEAALRMALQNKDMQLHYQPQRHLQDNRLYGVEALARWEHKEWGMIPPERFVAVAEECGLIGALTQWALEEACRQLADWRARNIPIPRIAVNLSASNFHNTELANMISALLQRYALPAHCLTLEITESVLMDTNPDTIHNIHAIHALGIRFAIDDFGTGYSSLSYLRTLPVSEIKLDKSFVRDMATDPTVLALVNAVIKIGESLGLTVVAEGVEDTAQYSLLTDHRCDVAQGHFIAGPATAQAIEQWANAYEAERNKQDPGL